MKVHVLFWIGKGDRPAYGIEGIYRDDAEYRADEDCDLLNKYAVDREWYVEDYEVKER